MINLKKNSLFKENNLQNQLPKDPLSEISLKQLGEKIKTRQVSCEELTKSYLDRIRLLNKNLHSYIYIDEANGSGKLYGGNQETGAKLIITKMS